jgi:hypothetical protein
MLTTVRTTQVMPGKALEAARVGKEIAGIVKRVTGVEVTFATAFGGNASDIAWIWSTTNSAAVEEMFTKLFADALYIEALGKLAPLLIPGQTRDQMWLSR